jgi:hypothetical protein
VSKHQALVDFAARSLLLYRIVERIDRMLMRAMRCKRRELARIDRRINTSLH